MLGEFHAEDGIAPGEKVTRMLVHLMERVNSIRCDLLRQHLRPAFTVTAPSCD